MADPGSADALNLRGIALHEQGRAGEAEASFRRALELDPGRVDVMNNLSILLREAGRLEECERLLRDALALRPDLAEAHLNLGTVLRMLGRLEEAGQSCRQAIALKPGFPQAYAALGMVQQALHQLPEAEYSLRQALARWPGHPDTQVRLGNLLWETGRWPEAEQQFRGALQAAAAAASAPAHNNIGIAQSALGRLEEAEASYRRALAVEPGFSDAHGNLGNTLRDMGRMEEAGACFRQALQLAPGSASAHLNEAIHRLLLGDYEAGWREYEWRWKDRSMRPDPRRFPQPLWTGSEELGGKSILLHAEQGLGDTIQFVRYVSMVAAKGASVVLEVPQVLSAALAGVAGAARVVAAGRDVPVTDFHCPLMSLPFVFGTRLDTIPPAPYLSVDAAAASAWRRELSPGGERLVGLCWKGNPRNRNDRSRSARLVDFLPLLETGGMRFVSLQQELDAEERALVAGRKNFVHQTLPLEEKAALAGALDLVISVDTLWAHWAGAIGKPLWAVLSLAPAWCWLLERDYSPWYASARLFRQTRRGDWAGVIGGVARELTRP